jgi:hypothetical protein
MREWYGRVTINSRERLVDGKLLHLGATGFQLSMRRFFGGMVAGLSLMHAACSVDESTPASPKGTGGGGATGPIEIRGDGGSGPDVDPARTECEACLVTQCRTEIDDCVLDPACYSPLVDNSGMFEQLVTCVDQLRATQTVTRSSLLYCVAGITRDELWPPVELGATTVDLIDCMASGESGVRMNYGWANAQSVSLPWPTTSCGATACSSELM